MFVGVEILCFTLTALEFFPLSFSMNASIFVRMDIEGAEYEVRTENPSQTQRPATYNTKPSFPKYSNNSSKTDPDILTPFSSILDHYFLSPVLSFLELSSPV